MNQADLIERIAADTGLTKADIKKVLDAQTAAVHEVVATGGEVTLHGIGKVSVAQRKARTGRNPSTGEPIQIAAKKVPNFSAVKALKDAANQD
ncbi:MAG: HU family DNA-binding protein [Methylotenera sp.]|jgi:DNA-binding protein HU-beta|nr:HU family DNA-binding protein [Methylotenera sp.]